MLAGRRNVLALEREALFRGRGHAACSPWASVWLLELPLLLHPAVPSVSAKRVGAAVLQGEGHLLQAEEPGEGGKSLQETTEVPTALPAPERFSLERQGLKQSLASLILSSCFTHLASLLPLLFAILP